MEGAEAATFDTSVPPILQWYSAGSDPAETTWYNITLPKLTTEIHVSKSHTLSSTNATLCVAEAVGIVFILFIDATWYVLR